MRCSGSRIRLQRFGLRWRHGFDLWPGARVKESSIAAAVTQVTAVAWIQSLCCGCTIKRNSLRELRIQRHLHEINYKVLLTSWERNDPKLSASIAEFLKMKGFAIGKRTKEPARMLIHLQWLHKGFCVDKISSFPRGNIHLPLPTNSHQRYYIKVSEGEQILSEI